MKKCINEKCTSWKRDRPTYCITWPLDLEECCCGEMILIVETDGGAEVPCSGVLSDLADAWDRAAKHYSVEAEKQPTTYLKGIRAGASYKLESCANELRALIKEEGR